MGRLLVFDLDGTLAAVGEGILPENLEKLKKLEEKGSRIAVCSGKPVYYLCGFLRQAGLKAPLLIGENGGVFQEGVCLPPKHYEVYPYNPKAREQIRSFRKRIDGIFPHMFYQPNEVGLTPFPKTEQEFDRIQQMIDQSGEALSQLLVYRHADSFDLVPGEINKKNGLKYLSRLIGIGPEDTIAIGDGVNDIPMFEYAACSIGIGSMDPGKTSLHFDRIGEALDYLLQ